MNALDVLIVVLVVGAAVSGARAGFAVTVTTGVGALGGLLLGAWSSRYLVDLASDPALRAAVVLATIVFTSAIVATLFGRAGSYAAVALRRWHLGRADEAGGAVVSAAGMLLSVWLLAVSLATVPQGGIGTAIQGSYIVDRLERLLPSVPELTSRLSRLIDPLGLPRVFLGLEPSPADPVTAPLPAEVQRVVDLAAPSTVKVVGSGCGAVITGSGVVVAPAIVVTNAHVVAGIARPTVWWQGSTRAAVPLLFDPGADLAVLRVDGLKAPALPLATRSVERGDQGAVLGYPGGGDLTGVAGAVLDQFEAVGRDIYDQAVVSREVVELQAVVKPGNSGGPFVTTDGVVGGIVFARSLSTAGVGYALDAASFADEITTAASSATPVGTGACPA